MAAVQLMQIAIKKGTVAPTNSYQGQSATLHYFRASGKGRNVSITAHSDGRVGVNHREFTEVEGQPLKSPPWSPQEGFERYRVRRGPMVRDACLAAHLGKSTAGWATKTLALENLTPKSAGQEHWKR